MARLKKNQLPSGNFRKKVYVGKDENGKKIYKSFTAPSKNELEAMISEWKADNNKAEVPVLSVYSAIESYIDSNANILSPTTIRSYRGILRTHIANKPIGDKSIHDITSTDVQFWISELTEQVTAKTVRNIFGLFKVAHDTFVPYTVLKVHLPKLQEREPTCPTTDDILTLMDYLEANGKYDLLLAVQISACSTMRRGEIAGLRKSDIDGNVVTVRREIVKGDFNEWVVKEPKTKKSIRQIMLPGELINEMNKRDDKIINLKPDTITNDFGKAVKACGLNHFRFHDLRHYSASVMAYLQISKKTSQERGGWTSSGVMEKIYQNTIDKEKNREEKKINRYFSKTILKQTKAI